ncbi:VOC family protein [Peribacillus frigoritolerans]|uniref:VOC family protein n=1 Tax=Peribacillus frigoritolerans TaxID=450367 RepID=UPI0035CEEF8F
MKFKEFHEVDICNQRSNIGYCFFFCPKKCRLPLTLIGYFIIREIHMTAITPNGLAVPDLDAAIKWYKQVLGFKASIRNN